MLLSAKPRAYFCKSIAIDGRCIAILFKSIGVRGRCDFPEKTLHFKGEMSGFFDAKTGEETLKGQMLHFHACTTLRKLKKAVAVFGVCAGVLQESSGKTPGKLLENFSQIAKCFEF